ncbi:hypothetical protein N9195_00185 [bacterium]|nr:hypothetical protein [bacterium]
MALADLTEIDFLSLAGQPDDRFVILPSWRDAVESLVSESWGDVTKDAQANLTEWLSANAPSRYQGVWNKRTKELRPVIETLVDERLLPLIPVGDDGRLRPALIWDLLLVAMDADFDDLERRPTLPSRLRTCYSSGHLPCRISNDQSQIVAF